MNIQQYRAAIGRWHLFTICRPLKTKHKFNCKLGESILKCSSRFKPSILIVTYILISLIIQSGDIEENPGPMRSLLINHINAHSLCPSDRSKKIDEIYSTLCIREAVDMICISETWLHSGISDDDVSLPDYQLFRKD